MISPLLRLRLPVINFLIPHQVVIDNLAASVSHAPLSHGASSSKAHKSIFHLIVHNPIVDPPFRQGLLQI